MEAPIGIVYPRFCIPAFSLVFPAQFPSPLRMGTVQMGLHVSTCSTVTAYEDRGTRVDLHIQKVEQPQQYGLWWPSAGGQWHCDLLPQGGGAHSAADPYGGETSV